MASKNFPGPGYNSLIENDPQIVKVPMDEMGWGARNSALPKGGDPRSNNPAAPTAPEMGIQHVKSK